MNFEMVQLQSICKKIVSGGTPKSTNPDFYNNGTIPWVKTKEVNNNRIHASENYITELGLKSSSAKIIPANSVIIAMYGNGDTAGRVAINKIAVSTNQACCNLIIDNSKADYRYVFYFLRTQYQRLVDLKNGGAQQNLNAKTIKEYPFPCAPLRFQNVVADLLEGLDEKITINQCINQTLEQMAQALFKSWFVDFEPVKAKMAVLEAGGSQEDATLAAMTAISGKDADALAVFEREHPEQYAELKATAELFPSAMQDSELGEIPEGWTLSCLGNHINILNGYAFKSPDYTSEGIFVLRTKNFHSEHYVERLDDDVYLPECFLKDYLKYNCEPYDYHMVMVGASIGHSAVIYPHTLPALRNQNMWCFRPNGQSVVGKAYTKKIVDEIIGGLKGFASGSAREFFRKGDFENKMIVSANKEIHNLFEKLCFPLIEQQGALCAQSERLSQLRDALLPKLLSGEITLPEAEQAVSEAENV